MRPKKENPSVRHIRVLLLVEDNDRLRTVLRRFVEPLMRVRVVEAGNASVALALARQWKPEVVLIDLTLPDMSGAAAIRLIKGLRPQAIIVAMTSQPEPDHYLEASRAGADVLVAKEALGIQLAPALHEAFRAAGARERRARETELARRVAEIREGFLAGRSWCAASLHWLNVHGPWAGRPRMRLLYAVDMAGLLCIAFHVVPTG
jgi:CheY-like chemotaxis protein